MTFQLLFHKHKLVGTEKSQADAAAAGAASDDPESPPPVLAGDSAPKEESSALPEEPSKFRKYGPCGLLLLVLLAVIIALVAVFVPSSASSSDCCPATTRPTNPFPTASPEQAAFDEMFAFAQTKSSSSSLSNPNSPQYKAVEWLAQDKVENGSNWSGYELLQRYVLRVLYHSTGGENWAGWNDDYIPISGDDDPFTWFRASSVCQEWPNRELSCNGQKVDHLDFHFQLHGTIPEELGLLTSLARLGMYENGLTGTIPTQLGQLTALTYLGLRSNQELTGSIPTQLGLLTALRQLDFYSNHLTGIIPSQLCQLTALNHLELTENQLTGTIPTQLGQLTALTELGFGSNVISRKIPTQLGQLTALTELNFQNNELTGTIPPTLTQLTNLEELYFHNNKLTGQVPSGFCAPPFPDWRADDSPWSGNILSADCMYEVQCDCCDRCYDKIGNGLCWSNESNNFESCYW